MKKNNEGFTLIELLAIIVILAIIAVITIPIILNVIENSRRGAAIDSAYGYKDAIRNYYVSKLSEDSNYPLLNGLYTIDDGSLSKVGEDTLDINVSGTKPSEGWVEIEKGEVKYFSMKIGDYVVSLMGDSEQIVAVKNGQILESETEKNAKIDAKEKAQAYVEALEDACSGADEAFPKGENVSVLNELNGLSEIDSLPTSGWVQFTEKCKVKDFSVKFDDYIASHDEEAEDNITVKNGELKKEPPYGRYDEDEKVTYYDTTWINRNIVYYDPGQIEMTNEDGTTTPAIPAHECDVTTYNANIDNLGKKGCMKWYAYSENSDGTINMILDHNTLSSEWISSKDYTGATKLTAESLGVTYPKIEDGVPTPSGTYTFTDTYNNRGPLTALDQLHEDTDNWAISKRTDSYTAEWNSKFNDEETEQLYKIDYSNYRARLISAEEIANITKTSGWTIESTSNISLRNYEWLKASGTAYYWTSSPYSGYPYIAWNIYADLSGSQVNTSNGIRPVITVSKSILQ